MSPRRRVLCALLGVTACTSAGAEPPGSTATGEAPAPAVATSPEATWGVEAASLRPTFGGTMLDFRYRVLDAVKALPLFDRRLKPYLFDPSSGLALGMPEDTPLGALRASPRNPPVAGKQYYVLFSSSDGLVRSGSHVTIALGDCKFEDVVVE